MPRLLSVNVGLPRDVTWNGKTVRTSVWKSPVTGRRMVRKLGIDGDAQANLAGPERITVADTDALLYLPGHSSEELQRALRIPALSKGGQSSFQGNAAARPQTRHELQNHDGESGTRLGGTSLWNSVRPGMRVTSGVSTDGTSVMESVEHEPFVSKKILLREDQ
jgi:3-alpha domain-containing YiiM-like protein